LKFNDPPAKKESDIVIALKNESWNNLMMGSITAVGYAGTGYGIDSFLSPSAPAKVETAPPSKKLEAKAEALDEKREELNEAIGDISSTLEDAKAERKEAERDKEAEKVAAMKLTDDAEKKEKILAAEKKVSAAERVEASVERRLEAAEKKYGALTDRYNATAQEAAKAPVSTRKSIITDSQVGSVLFNGISQLGISMGVRTAATLASATSDTFRKSVKYITPFVSGSLRGAVDYLALGKGTWRTITNSIVVTGLEYLSTAVVVGYD
jgi:hypothetical protein